METCRMLESVCTCAISSDLDKFYGIAYHLMDKLYVSLGSTPDYTKQSRTL